MHSTSWLHLGSTGCLSQVGSRSIRRSSRRSRTRAPRTLVCYTRRPSPPLSRRHGRSSQAYSACGTQHPMGGLARSYEIQDKYNHAGEGGRTDLRVVHGTVVCVTVLLQLHVTVRILGAITWHDSRSREIVFAKKESNFPARRDGILCRLVASCLPRCA